MVNTKCEGRVTLDGNPIRGAKVEVYETDFPIPTILMDTRLGEKRTDSNGKYSVSYSADTYSSGLFGEEKPDIYIVVTVDFHGVPLLFISPIESDVEEDTLELNYNIEPGDLPVGIDLMELINTICTTVEDTISEIPEHVAENISTFIQDLFDFLRKTLEDLAETGMAMDEILRKAGDDIEQESTRIAEEEVEPVLGPGAADMIKVIGGVIRDGLYAMARVLQNIIESFAHLLLDRPDLEHVIDRYHPLRRVPSIPQSKAETFNDCAIEKLDNYNNISIANVFNDSGSKNSVHIKGRKIYVTVNGNSKPLEENSYIRRSRSNPNEFILTKMISYTEKRNPGKTSNAPTFDMVAADGNRIFAKAKGQDRFFFTTLYEEFPSLINTYAAGAATKKIKKEGSISQKIELFTNSDNDEENSHSDSSSDVPGCYLKLDPEDNKEGSKEEHLTWLGLEDYDYHPAMYGYDFMPLTKYGLRKILEDKLRKQGYRLVRIENEINRFLGAFISPIQIKFLRHFRVFPDIMMVKVQPGVWHEIDSRPPYGSGKVPYWLPRYEHIVYRTTGISGFRPEVLLPGIIRYLFGIKEPYESIKFEKVISIGVANAHRHTHYEDIYGTEISSGPDHIMVGPVLDRGGFWDGTCNFYILCQLKKDGEFDPENPKDYAYGILWIDEQTYFSERWRLLHPADNDWGRLREWGMAGSLKRLFTLETIRTRPLGYIEETFWCPFAEGLVDKDSRMAVAKYVILVTSKFSKNQEQGEIYSIAFNWGGMDRTWRWRKLPSGAVAVRGADFNDESLEDIKTNIVLPQSIGLRRDMTIHIKGARVFVDEVIKGRWFQKYLPANNWEVPNADILYESIRSEKKRGHISHQSRPPKPEKGYSHPWKFISEECFEIADGFSHFGNYDTERPVSSRSQFYPVTPEEPAPNFDEDQAWLDVGSKLFTEVPAFNTIGPDPIEWLGKSDDEKIRIFRQNPPTLFPPFETRLKILNRGRLGWIAIHWDKRDDDLYPFKFPENEDEIKLTLKNIHNGAEWKIKLGRPKRKWCPPIVQFVSITPNDEQSKLTIRYHSKIEKKPKSLVEPFFDELKEFGYIEKRYIDRFRQYLSTFDNDPYDFYYRALDKEPPNIQTDLTIWRMKVYIIDNGTPKELLVMAIDEFSKVDDSEHEFEFVWEFDENQENEYTYEEVKSFFSDKGMCKYGTSIVFEDIVGHITTPEKIRVILTSIQKRSK